MDVYFPSCNLTKASKESSLKMRRFLKERMAVEGCCLYYNQDFPKDNRALIVCQACRTNLESKIPHENIISLWEYIDELEDFDFPNYGGIRMTLQDCFRDRHQENVHRAVRSLLTKMNIEIVEIENNRTKADFCGTLHLEADDVADPKISKLPEETQVALMTRYVEQYSTDVVVAYCNRCVAGIKMGGRNAIHIMDLLCKNL